uniref:Retrotransposon gag domain-containing protein n=1 Tax=Fagus sylvatica TaxID=28930 RepID=A0A2N9ELE6_FAGSY
MRGIEKLCMICCIPLKVSIPSCIMFPPNAPHVELKQGLLAILPDFRGLENENPYVHIRAFEEVINSFYAQHAVETAKLRFFPFSLKDRVRGWLYTLKPRSIGNWGEMGHEFYKKYFPPHKAKCYLRAQIGLGSPSTTAGRGIYQLKEEDTMKAKLDSLTKEIEALKLKDTVGAKQGYQAEIHEHEATIQKHDAILNRLVEDNKEFRSHLSKLTTTLSVNEKGKFPSQAHIPHGQYMAQGSQDKLNNEHINVVTTRSGKTVVTTPVEEQTENRDNIEEPTINEPVRRPISVPFPQALKTSRKLDSSPEILENLRQVRINLPLLHVIKQVPSYAKILKDLCTMKRKQNVKKTAFLTEQVSALIQHKIPPKYKDPGCPTISCIIGNHDIEQALLDLGASVNLMPYSVAFLATANALINCRNGLMKLSFGHMTLEVNIFNIGKHLDEALLWAA